MEKLKEFVAKNKIAVVAIVGVLVGVMIAPSGISEDEFNNVKNDYNSAKKELETINTDLETAKNEIKGLESKVAEAKPYFEMDNAEKEAMKIEADKKAEENKKEQERLAEEKAKEEEAKAQAELDARSVTLGNGTYLVGKDIPEGVYDLFAIKGGGNVMSTGQVNAIMGVGGKEDFYQREQQNVALKEGTSIELRRVTVKFVPDDGYVINN